MQPERKERGLCVCVNPRGDGEKARDREEGQERVLEAVGVSE